MSTIYERDGWWYLQWFEQGKKRKRSLKTQDKAIAKRLQKIYDARLTVGKAGIGSDKIVLDQAMEDYLILKSSVIQPESHRRLREHCANWSRFLSDANIRNHLDLSGAEVGRFVAMRKADEAAEKTIFEEMSTMRGIIRLACAERNISEPNFKTWPKITKRPAHPERLGFYSPEELRKLIEHFKGHEFGPVLAMGLYTGARVGELAKLRIRNIRLAEGMITITQEKTGKSADTFHRSVDIHPDLVETIRKLVEGKSPEASVLPQIAERHRFWPRDMLQQACRKLSIPYKRFHGLRHSFATYALASGLSIRDLQELIGHTNLSTTAKYLRQAQALKSSRAGKIRFDGGGGT